jgi:hypothetical protein
MMAQPTKFNTAGSGVLSTQPERALSLTIYTEYTEIE